MCFQSSGHCATLLLLMVLILPQLLAMSSLGRGRYPGQPAAGQREIKPLIRRQGDASQQGPLVGFCKQQSCNIWAVAHPCYPWIWAALGCFALGPHEPLKLRSVSFSFLTETPDLLE